MLPRARQTSASRLHDCQCDNMRTLWLVTYMSVRAIQPASPTIGHHLAKPQQTLLDPYFMRACMGIMNLWFRTDVYGQYTGISNRRGWRCSPVLKALLCCSRSLVLVGSTQCLSLQMENKQQASSLHAFSLVSHKTILFILACVLILFLVLHWICCICMHAQYTQSHTYSPSPLTPPHTPTCTLPLHTLHSGETLCYN